MRLQLNANNSLTWRVDALFGSNNHRTGRHHRLQDLETHSHPKGTIMNRSTRLIASITIAAAAVVGVSAPAFSTPKSDAITAVREQNRARIQATYDANKVRRDATYTANSARRDATFQSCLTGAAAATTKEAREAAKASCKTARENTKVANKSAWEQTRDQNKAAREATRAANKAAIDAAKATVPTTVKPVTA